jgi:hypothetical protein
MDGINRILFIDGCHPGFEIPHLALRVRLSPRERNEVRAIVAAMDDS